MKGSRFLILNIWMVFCLFFSLHQVIGQSMDQSSVLPDKEEIRVVLLGNGMIEIAQKYGTLEMALLSQYPGKKITFRNLGWSGDTVEAEARSYITSLPKPYDLLLQQLKSAKPDVVILGYGSMESYDGEGHLSQFSKNYNRLLDEIISLEAIPVLCSTLPQSPGEYSAVDLEARNAQLQLYSNEIAQIAQSRNLKYIDLFNPFLNSNQGYYEPNGIHLNKQGYQKWALLLNAELAGKRQPLEITIDVKQPNSMTVEGGTIENLHVEKNSLSFEFSRFQLPLYGWTSTEGSNIRIAGLKKGVYSLSVNNELVLVGTAKQWKEGMTLAKGELYDKMEMIQEKILEINDLFFWAYRPLNRTYLVGMRRHEQGQNSYELEWNDLFINRLEEDIMDAKRIQKVEYQLQKVN